MGQAHGVTSSTPVTAERAEHIARVMAGLGAASRVRILGRLREAPCTVGELMVAVEMAQPAVSHQLRILRDLGLVVGKRDGRYTSYSLHDSHVAMLLDESLRHIDHLRAAAPDTPGAHLHIDHQQHDRSTMTEEHPHDAPHAHEHEHEGETHSHAHTTHEHEHVEHEHDHEHEGDAHSHPHVHQEGLEEAHEHQH